MKNTIWRSFGPLIGAILLAIVTVAAPATSNAEVFLSVRIGPPALPVYEQPLIPGPGYIWTPGYWAWGPDGYYWVPGTWVLAPFEGALWTPGYWAFDEGLYYWHAGYWGLHVGFYGGICYGFGYTGVGYHGGYWEGRSFRYNRAVNNVNVTYITNTYNTTVVNPPTRVSFNGGPGGITARPTPRELIAGHDRHTPLLPVQARHELAAGSNRALLASVNHGHPALAATPRPERFTATGAAPARSFSQEAALQRHPEPRPQGSTAVPNRAPREVRPPMQPQAQAHPPREPRAQAPMQPQAQAHPPREPRVQAPMQPQAQAHPPREPRAQAPMQPQAQTQEPMRPHPLRPPAPYAPPAQAQPRSVAPPQAQQPQARPERETRGGGGGGEERRGERQHPG